MKIEAGQPVLYLEDKVVNIDFDIFLDEEKENEIETLMDVVELKGYFQCWATAFSFTVQEVNGVDYPVHANYTVALVLTQDNRIIQVEPTNLKIDEDSYRD
jgi:hypothetical protein